MLINARTNEQEVKKRLTYWMMLILPFIIWGCIRAYYAYVSTSQDCVLEILPNANKQTHNQEASISRTIDKFTLTYDSINDGLLGEDTYCYINGELYEIGKKWFDGNRFFEVSLNPKDKSGYVTVYTYDPIIEIIKKLYK